MDISKQFSLTDFLAYFFPGLFGAVGLYLLLLLTPLRSALQTLPLDLATGIIFLALSYMAGVIFSGFSMTIIAWVGKVQKHKNPRDIIPLDKFQEEVLQAFLEVFNYRSGSQTQWSEEHFRMCRALVLEKMPVAAQSAERQSSLRQLRSNITFPIFIWLAVGLFWGLWSINNGLRDWGIGLIIASVLLSFFALRITLNGMYKNEEREVRRFLVAFLVGYKTGLFGNGPIRGTRIQEAVSKVRAAAQAQGTDKLTPAEVETEIKLARRGRKK